LVLIWKLEENGEKTKELLNDLGVAFLFFFVSGNTVSLEKSTIHG
jgi:hypothetical protein